MSKRRLSDAWLVAYTWLGSRALLLIGCFVVMAQNQITFEQAISRWDVLHFFEIAKNGYTESLNIAFFPGLPALLALGVRFGIPMYLTGMGLSLIGSALAAAALYRLGGTTAACLWLVAPMAVFAFVPYTEALFCAAAFWAWERGRAGQWGVAALLAAVACTFRISGLFLIGALGLLILTSGRDALSLKLARCLWMLVPFAVLVAYAYYLQTLTGSWFAWFEAQEQGWARVFTWPWDSLQNTIDATDPARWEGRPEVPVMFFVEIVSMAVGLLVVVISLFLRRWAESGWVGVQVLTFGTSYWFMSVNRAILLWFPVFTIAGSMAEWAPKNGFGRYLWRVLVALGVTVSVLAMLAWAWIFFSGGWAS